MNKMPQILQANESERLHFDTVVDYGRILSDHGLPFRKVDFYYQVGEIEGVQGWLLHVSVVKWQVAQLLKEILQLLIHEKVTFKIVQHQEIARAILYGEGGVERIGKIITIYPSSEEQAVFLAKELITLTNKFKGPRILTDAHLGGTIYCRYGAFNPVLVYNENGQIQKCIHDGKGNLVIDQYKIPFDRPTNVTWPFSQIGNSSTFQLPFVFLGKYKQVQTLKVHSKGNVIKASYSTKYFSTRPCIIKQGVANMWSDENGRDMVERLKWQFKLHNDFGSIIPVPKAIDFFIWQEDAFFVMEYINGISLHEKLLQLKPNCECWPDLTVGVRLKIIDWAIKIANAIAGMHKEGILHRDITPVNFMVTEDEQIRLIDIEMAYSITAAIPTPPYQFGTFGFVSPQQNNNEVPSVEDDVYGIGALLAFLFSGLSPLCLDISDIDRLCDKLEFFIEDREIANLLTHCLSEQPHNRPGLADITQKLISFQGRVKSSLDCNNVRIKGLPNDLTTFINNAIKGLMSPPIPIRGDLWQSAEFKDGQQTSAWKTSLKFNDGIPGILSVLSKAARLGYDISPSIRSYKKGWMALDEFIEGLPDVPPGLFGGAAGISVAIQEALLGKLLPDESIKIEQLRRCLMIPNQDCNIATGLAGQGLVLMQCGKWLEKTDLQNDLNKIVTTILNVSEGTWSWVQRKGSDGRMRNENSFWYGNTGISYFLLKYGVQYESQEIIQVASKAIEVAMKEGRKLIKEATNFGLRSCSSRALFLDGILGTSLLLLEGYEYFRNEDYKNMGLEFLNLHPFRVVHSLMGLDYGISALGCIYLKAYKVTGDEQWFERAKYVTNFFINTSLWQENNSLYWINNSTPTPTSNIMTGNTGVIFFLIEFAAVNESKNN